MSGYRKIIHTLLGLGGLLALAVGTLVWPQSPAGAAVTLVSFEVAYDPENTGIWVTWESASEFQTRAYEIRRAVASNDVGDAAQIHWEFAGGGAAGASYAWLDNDESVLELGQEYFYWLYEVTDEGVVQLRVGDQAYRSVVFGENSTSTATATATSTGTATSTPTDSSRAGTAGAIATSTPTPTGQAAASQRATNTPSITPVLSSNTPTFTPVPPTTSPGTAANTPLPPRVSSNTPDLLASTSVLPTATLLIIQPTAADLAVTSDPGVQPEAIPASLRETTTVTALPQQVAQAGNSQAGEAGATRQARPTATPRPTEVAGGSSQVSTLLLVVGGGSLCGAGLLVLVALFVWRRR